VTVAFPRKTNAEHGRTRLSPERQRTLLELNRSHPPLSRSCLPQKHVTPAFANPAVCTITGDDRQPHVVIDAFGPIGRAIWNLPTSDAAQHRLADRAEVGIRRRPPTPNRRKNRAASIFNTRAKRGQLGQTVLSSPLLGERTIPPRQRTVLVAVGSNRATRTNLPSGLVRCLEFVSTQQIDVSREFASVRL